MDKILLQIAADLKVRPAQIQAAVALPGGGATVPFIARDRKEVTEGLDDIQLRELESRLGYLRELEERRTAVLKSIDTQGKLSPELAAAINAAPTKQELGPRGRPAGVRPARPPGHDELEQSHHQCPRGRADRRRLGRCRWTRRGRLAGDWREIGRN